MKELSLHILDLVQNSISANATKIEVSVNESRQNDLLEIEITDNGNGIPEHLLDRVTDPFFTSRTTRNVGLGIPLYKQQVELCNGNLTIISEEGKGTKLNSMMQLLHIDRQPMGDIAGIIVLLLTSNPNLHFIYSHQTENGRYMLDSAEMNELLGNNGKYELGIMKFIKEMIQENLKDIQTNC